MGSPLDDGKWDSCNWVNRQIAMCYTLLQLIIISYIESICHCVYLSIYLSIYLSTYLASYPSIYLPTYLSIYLSIYLSASYLHILYIYIIYNWIPIQSNEKFTISCLSDPSQPRPHLFLGHKSATHQASNLSSTLVPLVERGRTRRITKATRAALSKYTKWSVLTFRPIFGHLTNFLPFFVSFICDVWRQKMQPIATSKF